MNEAANVPKYPRACALGTRTRVQYAREGSATLSRILTGQAATTVPFRTSSQSLGRWLSFAIRKLNDR